MYPHLLPVLDFHQGVEGRRRPPLQDRFLRAPATGLIVPQGHRFDPTHQVAQGRIGKQVFQRDPVRRAHQLHASLRDRARRQRLQGGTDFVNDHRLRGVVLHRFNHHPVLELRGRYHHPPRPPDALMRNVAVTGDLIRRVHHHHPLAQLLRQHPRHLPQHRRLPHPRPPQQQQARPRLDQVPDNLNATVYRPPAAAGQAHDFTVAIPQRRDSVQRVFDSSPVVVSERAHRFNHVPQMTTLHLPAGQLDLRRREPHLRPAAQVQDHLHQVLVFRQLAQRLGHRFR